MLRLFGPYADEGGGVETGGGEGDGEEPPQDETTAARSRRTRDRLSLMANGKVDGPDDVDSQGWRSKGASPNKDRRRRAMTTLEAPCHSQHQAQAGGDLGRSEE